MPASKAQRTATAERRAKAVALRLTGTSFDEIAQKLGYTNRGAAWNDINRALEANIAEQRSNVEVYREQELLRLDLLWVEAWKVLKTPHLTVSHGKVIYHEDGPLLDDGPVLNAIDRCLKIQERRARYLGLDAPTRHEVTLDEIDAQIRDLTAELGVGPNEVGEASGTAPAAPDQG
jgi:hypothetical protein